MKRIDPRFYSDDYESFEKRKPKKNKQKSEDSKNKKKNKPTRGEY